jgi:glyoxylase-like metal-dependent hydrolase (beta-lactamase superfamily II)
MRIAEKWFEMRRVDDAITHLWEPHVDPLVRCNIWHVRGRDRDLVIDTGLGIQSLREVARSLFGHAVVAVATHWHFDHTGGLHEFEERIGHRSEARWLAEPPEGSATLRASEFPKELQQAMQDAGYPLAGDLLTALPHADYDLGSYALRGARPTRAVDEGDRIDLGDRSFEVLHLAGHSPGSIGLWEASTGTLFSGDAVYDGPLLDMLPDADIAQYLGTMRRLRELPVEVVHAGHEPSFGRARLIDLCDAYLKSRGA